MNLIYGMVEVILISLALSDRIRISEVTSREKIDALNRELTIFNEQLENEVDQKTESALTFFNTGANENL